MMKLFSNKQQPDDTKIAIHFVPSDEVEQLIFQLSDKLFAEVAKVEGQLPPQKRKTFSDQLHQQVINVCDQLHQENVLTKIEEKIKSGKMDDLIFSSHPQKTDELDLYINQRNGDFCQILLCKATSTLTLDFWFSNNVKLPNNALALAIHLKSHKVVFEYLKEKGSFANLTDNDKEQLLSRAKLLQQHRGESYSYVCEQLQQNDDILQLS